MANHSDGSCCYVSTANISSGMQLPAVTVALLQQAVPKEPWREADTSQTRRERERPEHTGSHAGCSFRIAHEMEISIDSRFCPFRRKACAGVRHELCLPRRKDITAGTLSVALRRAVESSIDRIDSEMKPAGRVLRPKTAACSTIACRQVSTTKGLTTHLAVCRRDPSAYLA